MKSDPDLAVGILPSREHISSESVDPKDFTTAPYQRKPYVRVILPDTGVIDAKAVRWTAHVVLIRWD